MQALLKQKDTELEERGKLLYKTKARQLSTDLWRCVLLTATMQRPDALHCALMCRWPSSSCSRSLQPADGRRRV